MQRYNILRLVRFDVGTGGLIYPKAINQLFIGLYFMELYLIGLFFLVRNEHDKVACIGQAIIMIIVTLLTATYQILLNQAMAPLFKHLPIILSGAEQPNNQMQKTTPTPWYYILQRLYNDLHETVDKLMEQEHMIGGSSKSQDTHAETVDKQIEDNRFPMVVQSKDLTAGPPVIWLPHDTLGLSKDAIEQTKSGNSSVLISDENAELSKKAAVRAWGDPPTIQ